MSSCKLPEIYEKGVHVKKTIVGLLMVGLAGCHPHHAKDDVMIPFAGIEGGLTTGQMEKNISRPLQKSTKKILKNLDKTTNRENDWNLTRISVGLFLVGESEFTNVYKLEVEPSVELRFQQL